jgi:hypothetical protein
VEGAIYSPDGKRILSWSADNALRLWDASWQGDNLFEIACNYAPMMNSKEEMERLSKRYGVKVDEPICHVVKRPRQDALAVRRIDRAQDRVLMPLRLALTVADAQAGAGRPGRSGRGWPSRIPWQRR